MPQSYAGIVNFRAWSEEISCGLCGSTRLSLLESSEGGYLAICDGEDNCQLTDADAPLMIQWMLEQLEREVAEDPHVLSHQHYLLRIHGYYDKSTQTDQRCRQPHCKGIARVQSAWAPDTGMNWLKCCCCDDEWNPGTAIHPPGVGELLNRA